MTRETPMRILLVEDNPGDARLAQEAFKDSALAPLIDWVEDGEAAMAFLRRQHPYEDAARPDLVLLDLNLPKKDGREVLAEVKQDPNLKRIPVIILSSSRNEDDIFKTYNLHANCYIAKPIDLTQFMKVIRSVENFWLTVVRLPSYKATA